MDGSFVLIDEVLHEGEKIPSDQLDAARKARLITFLKGIKQDSTFDEAKTAHVRISLNIFLQRFH